MGRKKEEPPAGAPLWMCTFSDMMSLLLCFFVLLFALSTIEKVKFVQTIASIQGSFGRIPRLFNTSYVKPVTINPQEVQPVQQNKTIERAKEAIAQKARSKLVAEEASKEVVVEGVEEGIRFTLTGRILFDAGVAILKPEGKEMLRKVGEILEEFPDLRVRIEGHTDDGHVPPNSVYPNNWILAEERAKAVMYYLRDYDRSLQKPENQEQKSLEERISFMSCGQFRPRFPNDSLENRALNRRVEIILLQGNRSIEVPGELPGTGDIKIDPNDTLFVPKG